MYNYVSIHTVTLLLLDPKNMSWGLFLDLELPKIYCLPKLQQTRNSVQTYYIHCQLFYIFFLAKIIFNELKKCNFTSNTSVKNSFDLIKKLDNCNIPDNHKLISLHISSLFTNISHALVKQSLDKRYDVISRNCKIPYRYT